MVSESEHAPPSSTLPDEGFCLDQVRVQPPDGLLTSRHGQAHLEPKVMAVLVELAGQAGQVVDREQLIANVWAGTFVTDDALTRCIYQLRRNLQSLLGADFDGRVIETIPKRGYRLAIPVTPAPISETEPSTLAGTARRWKLAVAAGVVIAAVAGVIFWSPFGTGEGDLEIDPYSIAVLPFANMSADPGNDYFSDGLAEEILTTLAQVGALKVASRTDSFQFRGEDKSIEEISKQLRVANVLEGSVRREREGLRVTAQLIDASSGAHLWASTYDRNADDVLAIQQDIALNIAEALADTISDSERRRLAALPTHSIEAYDNYLIGNYLSSQWRADGYRRAIEHYERAVALDPEFSKAHLAMGWAYYFAGTHYGWMPPEEAIPNVKTAVTHGIASSDSLVRAEALALYGDILTWHDRDWAGALEAYEQASALFPVPMRGHALLYSIIGEHDLAIAIWKQRGQHNIDSKGERSNFAWAYFNARRYTEAKVEAEAALAFDENFAEAYRILGRAQLLLGETDAAVQSFSRAVDLLERSPNALSDLAVSLARTGGQAEARAILEELLDLDGYVPAPLIAQVYANLGDFDSAFDWLEKGLEDGDRSMIFLKVNPFFDPLRDDPRFSELLSVLNLESGPAS